MDVSRVKFNIGRTVKYRGAAYTLATFPTPFPSTPASNLTPPWCVYLTNGGKTLKMHYQAGTMFLIK